MIKIGINDISAFSRFSKLSNSSTKWRARNYIFANYIPVKLLIDKSYILKIYNIRAYKYN